MIVQHNMQAINTNRQLGHQVTELTVQVMTQLDFQFQRR